MTIATDEQGATVLLSSEVLHRVDLLPDEEVIIEARTTSGETHPAVERAMDWARGEGYHIGVIIW